MNRREEEEKTTVLVAQKEALGVYLEALLRDPFVLEIPEQEAAVETPVQQALQVAGRPAWGDEVFQALLFRVNGLTLAVPLVELSGVLEWDTDKVTPLPGHAPWYLGLVLYRERNVPVVDTARLVMPEDRQAHIRPWQERLRHVVFIADGHWGLACDELGEVITLQPDDVRWRSSRTRRRWLAGTVIEHMCALLDPPVFADVLASGMENLPEDEMQKGSEGDE